MAADQVPPAGFDRELCGQADSVASILRGWKSKTCRRVVTSRTGLTYPSELRKTYTPLS
jgi:hypothetical protein